MYGGRRRPGSARAHHFTWSTSLMMALVMSINESMQESPLFCPGYRPSVRIPFVAALGCGTRVPGVLRLANLNTILTPPPRILTHP